jgi:3-dehydroquinate synthase
MVALSTIENIKEKMQNSEISNQVFFGESGIEYLQEYLKTKQTFGVFVLVDDNTLENCWPVLMSLCEGLEEVELLQIASGESEKNLEGCGLP